MGWQPGEEPGPGEVPDPDDAVPGGRGGGDARGSRPRDPRLAGFASGGKWNAAAPSAALALILAAVSGPETRCAGANRDELLGVTRQWAALESWAAAGKLGSLRDLIRDDDQPLPGGGYHGDLPDGWSKSLTHQVSLALAMPPTSAEHLLLTAWTLQVRMPGIGRLLADGTLTPAKAKTIEDALFPLTDEDAASAEAMLLPQLAGKTYGQVDRLAQQAAITVDPGSAARRREDAERNRATVAMRRSQSGAVNLSGYDLPTADALAAHAQVCARAQEYKDSNEFPDVRIDQLRAQAYVDILNNISAADRIAAGQPATGLGAPFNAGDPTAGDTSAGDPTVSDPVADDAATGTGTGTDSDCPCRECDGRCWPPDGQEPDDDGPDGPDGSDGPEGPGGSGEGPDRPDGDSGRGSGGASPAGRPPPGSHPSGPPPVPPPRPSPPPPGEPSESPPKLTDLVIPLPTLLGLAWRPGESHGIGPLDPDLCRALAATAVSDPHSALCVTVTDDHGYAIAHGCARTARAGAGNQAHATGHGRAALAALPARVNLTVNRTVLTELSGTAPPADEGPPGSWSFTTGDHDSPGDRGTWLLGLPDGRVRTVTLEPVPTFDCDHARESHAYKPNDMLRHLVQLRDYQCTFPTCSRHARESDFEHATPYDQGGRTCGCNAGARSRACHQVKQTPGWNVTQPQPGWHRWATPAGRVYVQEPKRYPF
jgi:Domain of unknown function (DUF222)